MYVFSSFVSMYVSAYMHYSYMSSKSEYKYIYIYRRLEAKGSYLPLWRVSDRIL